MGAELPPPALSLFGGTQAGELGCIGRSTRFGRALWCLAKSSMKTLELFTGIGGGTSLVLAHSMRSQGRFFSVDRDAGNAWHATQVLKTAGVTAEVLQLQAARGLPVPCL